MKQRTLYIVSLIAIVNALGYGIIIPLLYSYGTRFGITAFWNGILFALFSLAQFISTPIIGRLSDRYGRRPMLIYSLIGSTFSFVLFALAVNPLFLFAARILDGISGGNISVAQAVISDQTKPEERIKWFGVLGAAFGFGFLFGPAMGGFLAQYSLTAPFWLAAFISLFAVGAVVVALPETLTIDNKALVHNEPLFDLKKLASSLFEPFVGLVLATSFLINTAFSLFILGFQAHTNDALKMSPAEISLLFTAFGAIGLIMQGGMVGPAVKRFGQIPLLLIGLALIGISCLGMAIAPDKISFILASLILGVGNAFPIPVITGLLSQHTRKEDQGGIMGINQSYISVGSIIGPIIGGSLATISSQAPFYGATVVVALSFIAALVVAREHGKHVVNL